MDCFRAKAPRNDEMEKRVAMTADGSNDGEQLSFVTKLAYNDEREKFICDHEKEKFFCQNP